MTPVFTVETSDASKALEALPKKIHDKVLRSALRAGGKLVVAPAEAHIHSISGLLAAEVGVHGGADRPGEVAVNVGATGNKKVRHPGFYGRAVEIGHAARGGHLGRPGKRTSHSFKMRIEGDEQLIKVRETTRRPSGQEMFLRRVISRKKHRLQSKRIRAGQEAGKRVPPHPWLAPAWEQVANQVAATITQGIVKGIEREAAKGTT